MVSNAELEVWLKERRRVRKFLQSCPLLKLPHWDREALAVATDWFLERGWESAEEWFDYINPNIVRRDLVAGIDPEAPSQPVWKTIVAADTWSVRVDWSGRYPAELEIAQEQEPTPGGDAEAVVYNQDDNRWHLRDDAGNMTRHGWANVDEAEEQLGYTLAESDGASYEVYTIQCEQQKRIEDENGDERIVPIGWDPSWVGVPSSREEWFIRDLGVAARSAGTIGGPAKLVEMLCSDDPRALASAYFDIVGHFGAHEFDQEPIVLSEDELQRRWS